MVKKKYMNKFLFVTRFRLILLNVFVLTVFSANAQNEFDVITGKWLGYTDARNSLYHHLSNLAYDKLQEREKEISSIHSLESWQERQKLIREKLQECTGPFPGKTPLNAKIVKTIEKESFRIEHVVFESQPGFYVTSSLYLPTGIKKNSRLPAVIYCSGHSADGYRSDVYQHVILNLVKKGFIVFAFDPVGQGERLEYFDQKTGRSSVGGPTSEHSYPGAQAYITGSSQAMHMIFDGIRAVDYLLTRKEVDPSRIGITGRSGGGTQSAMIAAYDDRILAAAPENYITNYTRLLQTIGPQDAEQNLTGFIGKGLDHPDFLIVRAPKPALMITTTGDMFSIQGAMETEQQVSLIYKAYSKPGNFSRSEDDAGHASTKKNREAMYAFFQLHLNNPGKKQDEEVTPLTKEELRVTETGQVSTSLGGETVFSLNLKKAQQLENELIKSIRTSPDFQSGVEEKAMELSGFQDHVKAEQPVFTGRIKREGYSIEKYFIKGEGDYVVPYLLFKPITPSGKAMIYLHPDGKGAEAKAGGEVELFVRKGFTVLAPDLVGTGETGPGDLKGDAYFKGASHNLWYAAMLTGRSITGVRAGDVSMLTRVLKGSGNFREITGFARQTMTPVLLHSAVMSKEISSMILLQPCSSLASIVSERFYDPFLIQGTVPGALLVYDLPDLEAAFAPRKLLIAGSVDGTGNSSGARISKDLDIVRAEYQKQNAAERLKIVPDAKPDYDMMIEWLDL